MAAAISEGSGGWLAKRTSPGNEIVKIVLYTANTADSDDTIAIDLADYGASTFLAIFGCEHGTEGSIVGTEAPTTTLSGTTLTIAIAGSSNDDDPRCYIIWAHARPLTWTALV